MPFHWCFIALLISCLSYCDCSRSDQLFHAVRFKRIEHQYSNYQRNIENVGDILKPDKSDISDDLYELNVPFYGVGFQVPLISSSVSHFVVQVYSPFVNITLSYNASVNTPSQAVNGSHVGLICVRNPMTNVIHSVLYINSTQPNVKVWIRVNTYSKYDPIPGACNQIYDRENEINLFQISTSPMLENLNFAMGSVWMKDPGNSNSWRILSCSNVSSLTNIEYMLYAIPVAVVGGQSWYGIKSRASNDDSEEMANAADVTEWPISPETFMEIVFPLTDVKRAMKYGLYLGSYNPKTKTPPRFTLSRRFSNVYAFTVIMKVTDSSNRQSAPTYANYMPYFIYTCPSDKGGEYQPFNTNSFQCHPIPRKHLLSLGVGLIAAAAITFLFFPCLPRLCAIVMFGLCMALHSFIIISWLGNSDGESLILWLAIIIPAVLSVFYGIWLFVFKNPLGFLTKRTSFFTIYLMLFLLLALAMATPLNLVESFKSRDLFSGVFFGVNVFLALCLVYFPRLFLSLSLAILCSFSVGAGIAMIFFPQSLIYSVVMDQYLRFSNKTYLSSIQFNPIGMYDIFLGMGILCSTIVLTILMTCMTTRLVNRSVHPPRARNRGSFFQNGPIPLVHSPDRPRPEFPALPNNEPTALVSPGGMNDYGTMDRPPAYTEMAPPNAIATAPPLVETRPPPTAPGHMPPPYQEL